ncbi:MAG: T9SS type A sorting domain-containing protein [Bacteroidaceae bacterium]|nr:T9SS type A sorting domain-containing protein [Bacteroidaceae bacterium]
MRRLIYLTLSILLAVPAFSQDKGIAGNDSLTQSLQLDNLRKIAFKDGSVVTTYSDGSTRSQKLSQSNKLQFTSTDRQDEGITQDEETYTIYDLSGRPVKTHTDRSCDQPFDLNDLTSGIYLLKTGNRTIKIVK